MIAVARFEIPLGQGADFRLELEGVRAVLAEAIGFLCGEVGQNGISNLATAIMG